MLLFQVLIKICNLSGEQVTDNRNEMKDFIKVSAVFSFKTKLIGDTIYTLAKVNIIYNLIIHYLHMNHDIIII